MTSPRRWLRDLRALLADRRGAAQTEYVVLVGTMGLAIVFALVAAGPALIRSFERTRDMVSSPFP
jgi:Flp pilus assembly pilin Flp